MRFISDNEKLVSKEQVGRVSSFLLIFIELDGEKKIGPKNAYKRKKPARWSTWPRYYRKLQASANLHSVNFYPVY